LAVAERLSRLRHTLLEKDLDGCVITQPDNCRYISGFTGSGAILLVSRNSAVLVTDFIYAEQAKQEASSFHIAVAAAAERFSLLLSGDTTKRLGFEPSILCFSDYQRLAEVAGRVESALVPAEGLVESLRSIKEPEELASMERSAALADSAVRYIMAEIRPGMTEKEAAWEIEKYLRERNSQAMPFEIIVASGPNAALPHARPKDRPIATSEPVILDLGARVDGYCSDISRTLCLGRQDDTFRRIHDLVLQAQQTALEGIQAGMTGAEADGLARAVIQNGGYGESFGHGLGHGVGLAVHEEPRLGPGSAAVVAEDMVFTIEPAIYVSGWGGVRIEDTVLMEKGRARPLTAAPSRASL
jgi:Xaa-Pro aminopeptidase